ncbi:class I SAM-dependent methyltransferase [Streptomyces sp. RB6PN25]|uniref:Class I SAM-dependent methyltransferase n=1 Tax=Streptomyces humicola TaxID=2953240 RepID=A0ABT1PQE1_9ACTN|nr:class I SAM-dependent methyltransferase [Streptomyces humicola]MCQ4079888.1 class I SAM-dependent methyltransferase [Streptomyces humicola]
MNRQASAPRDAVHHPVFARFYSRIAPVMDERAGVAALRRELLAGLSGRVIEIGAGTGLNFPHYPREVCEVVAIEPDRHLRRLALDAACRAGLPVDVVPGTAEGLPVKSEAFDGAVACLVLCSVRDQRRALAELHRVLKPGGELRIFEHVRAPSAAAAVVQWAVDHTCWPLLMGGCHTGRDTVANVEAAGFGMETLRRLRIPQGRLPVPSATHVLATVRRPG